MEKLFKTNAHDLLISDVIILWGTQVAPGGSKLHRIVISAIESANRTVLSLFFVIYIVSTYSYIYLNIYKSMPGYLRLYISLCIALFTDTYMNIKVYMPGPDKQVRSTQILSS